MTLAIQASVTYGQGSGKTGPCTVYTDIADFDLGHLFNLNVVTTPDGDDCLLLKDEVKAWPFIAVANTARGTIARIAVQNLPLYGINEGDVVGEYFSAPLGNSRSPSRTTVDAYGNAWVANRMESANNKGSVARVGLVLGGTRVDSAGNVDPTGDYLSGPFDYCTCEDRDGDGLIKTARGYPHATGTTDYVSTELPWNNGGSADTNGGVTTAEDECITAYVRVAGTGTRFVAIDDAGDVWTGGTNNMFEKLDGATAQPVPLSGFFGSCGGYGGLVDPFGVIWSARWSNPFMRHDTLTSITTCLNINNYGVGIDPDTCHIWTTAATIDNLAREVSSAGVQLNAYPHTTALQNRLPRGIVVDNGSVWVAHSNNNTLGHLRTNGTFVGEVNLSLNPSSANGQAPHGVAVDTNQKIWAVNNSPSNNAMRVDPGGGPVGGGGFNVGDVDLVVDLGSGAGPYNYSDMTGSVLLQATAPQGSWTFIHDGGSPGSAWGTISYTAITDPGTSVTVRVRASDSPVPSGPWTVISNNVPFTGVTGQYLQVQVTLNRPAPCVGKGAVFLCDLTICKEPECSVSDEEVICALDGTGTVTWTGTIFNNSGQDAHHVLLTPMPPGSNVTITPNIINQLIPNGSSATVSATISGIPAGEEFCFVVTLLDETMESCCSFEVCIDPDCDCLQIRPETETIICDPTLPATWSYTFQFDNLTPDTLHHVYFFAPTGVTITPNYLPLTPPIPPNGTSAPIKLLISGASAGDEVCLDITVHDVNLKECCARTQCITLPDCKVTPVGACCYQEAGSTNTFCTVTTQQDCVTNFFNGTYLGDNVTCTPDPCHDVLEPSHTCNLRPIVTCCQSPIFTTPVVNQVLTICNNGSSARTYSWSIVSVQDPGCDIVLPPQALNPNQGVVTLSPGDCQSIQIPISCDFLYASGLPNATACLEATIVNNDTGAVCTTNGIVQAMTSEICFGFVTESPVIIDPGTTATVTVAVANSANPVGAVFYQLVPGTTAISINGLAPGSTVTNYVFVPTGGTTSFTATVALAGSSGPGVHDLHLLADVDRDGDFEPIDSLGLLPSSDFEVPCLADVSGDGAVGAADLAELLASWGTPGCEGNLPCPSDFNGDASVGPADLAALLSAWGACP